MFSCRFNALVAALSLLLVLLPSGECGVFKLPLFKGRKATTATSISAVSFPVESTPSSPSPAILDDPATAPLATPVSLETTPTPSARRGSILSQVRDPALLKPKESLLMVPLPVASAAAVAASRSSPQVAQLVGRFFGGGGQQAKALGAARSSSSTAVSTGQRRALGEVFSFAATFIAPPQFIKNAGPIKLGIWVTLLAAAGYGGGRLFSMLLDKLAQEAHPPSPVQAPPLHVAAPQSDNLPLLDADPPLPPPPIATDVPVVLPNPTPMPHTIPSPSPALPVVVRGWAPRVAVPNCSSVNDTIAINTASVSDSYQGLPVAPVVESELSTGESIAYTFFSDVMIVLIFALLLTPMPVLLLRLLMHAPAKSRNASVTSIERAVDLLPVPARVIGRLSERLIKDVTFALHWCHMGQWAPSRKELLSTHAGVMAQCPATLALYYKKTRSWDVSLLWDDGFAFMLEYMTVLIRAEREWRAVLWQARRNTDRVTNGDPKYRHVFALEGRVMDVALQVARIEQLKLLANAEVVNDFMQACAAHEHKWIVKSRLQAAYDYLKLSIEELPLREQALEDFRADKIPMVC